MIDKSSPGDLSGNCDSTRFDWPLAWAEHILFMGRLSSPSRPRLLPVSIKREQIFCLLSPYCFQLYFVGVAFNCRAGNTAYA